MSARHDHERVLELDPKYVDAKVLVGTHLYIIGSLSWPAKVTASVVGISGNKEKGLQYLRRRWRERTARLRLTRRLSWRCFCVANRVR